MLVRDVNRQTAYLNNPYVEKIKEYSEFARERGTLKYPSDAKVILKKRNKSEEIEKRHKKMVHRENESNELVDNLNAK